MFNGLTFLLKLLQDANALRDPLLEVGRHAVALHALEPRQLVSHLLLARRLHLGNVLGLLRQ